MKSVPTTMSTVARPFIPALLAGVLAAAPARGQDPTGEPSAWPVEPGVRFTFTPGLWLPRVVGDAGLGARRIDLEDELRLRDSEATASGELEIVKNDRWFMHFSGFDFEVSDSGTFGGFAQFGDVSLAPGDRYRAQLGFTSIAGELGMALPRSWPETEHGRLRLSPLAAVRFVDTDQKLGLVGGEREEVSGDWLGVMGGVRLDLQWRPPGLPVREVHLHASTAFGPALGGDGGTMWSVRATATVYVTEQVGLEFGFRLLHLDVEDGDYELDAGLQGLLLGVNLRF
ncbi:MAG: hypothetical protein ACYTJ0_01970 [Planctomycetota bacterium]|jgi:hypothetical protein